MKTLVSVLMPALNEELSIAAAMAGVLDQSGVDLELLVILAPSVDRTEDAVREMAAQDSRVRLLHNPRSIIPAALNLGLEAARGEFIARVDAHCRISPGYLARGVAWMQRNTRLASVGGLRTGTADTATGRAIALALSSSVAVGDSINHFATEPQLTDHASMAVTRTAAARSIGGWDEELQVNEDVDFDHRLRKAGHQIGFDPAMRIEWRVRETVPELFRQFRRYGRGKGQMIRKNGASAVRPPPPGSLPRSSPAQRCSWPAAWCAGMLWLPLLPYLAVIGWASVRSWKQRVPGQQTSAAAIPASFMAIHSGWGLGMLEGSVLGKQPARASGNSAVRDETPA